MQSWLDQQCSITDGVSHAIVLIQDRDSQDYSVMATWPAAGNTPSALLATARDAIRRQGEVISRRRGSELFTVEPGEILACPVMADGRMHGVVALSVRQGSDRRRQHKLEQLRCGCTWLGMLMRRERETGKHYLATMLEMAAMFLEHWQPQSSEVADPVITQIIDALNERLGTDASTLLQQIHATVHDARGREPAGETHDPADTENGVQARDLHSALENGELVLHYQPKVDLASGRIAAMEVLLRWQHPVHGLLAPAHFLPVAEEAGLMPVIDDWVLRSACRQLQAWQTEGYGELSVAVNLSAAGFLRPQLVRQLLGVLCDYGIEPARLEIEVTEATVMDNIDSAAGILRSLRDAGIRIAVDDFGTGYSSLNYLHRFPIRTIKIDRSFVREITSDPDIANIVRGIIAMAHASGLEIIAEGVETEAQLAFLRKLHCDQFQGYLFSRAVDSESAGQMLAMEAATGSLLDQARRVS